MGRLLSQGTQGQNVKALQDVLNFHIRRLAPLDVDGIFGPLTDATVREFQRANNLQVDGIVGPQTSAQLYEATQISIPMLIVPTVSLTPPKFGIQPPQLIPPLQWPGPPSPPPPPFVFNNTFTLQPPKLALLPSLSMNTPTALGLQITVPTRKDPQDPAVASRNAILELINNLPVNSKFKTFLASQVPSVSTKISPPGAGFNWGVKPLFDPFDPKGFGVAGNARFTIRVTEGHGGLPNMVIGAWGDGKAFLNFATKQGQPRPQLQGSGQVFLGLQGTF